MGCDIHMYVEVQDHKGLWHHVGAPYPFYSVLGDYLTSNVRIGRDYFLFGALNGVRVEVSHQAAPEYSALPADCSDYVKEAHKYYGDDGHSEGSLTLRKLDEFWKEYGHDLYPVETEVNRRKDGSIAEVRTSRPDPNWNPNQDRLDYFFEDFVNSNLRPLAWDAEVKTRKAYRPGGRRGRLVRKTVKGPAPTSDRVRIVFWYDN